MYVLALTTRYWDVVLAWLNRHSSSTHGKLPCTPETKHWRHEANVWRWQCGLDSRQKLYTMFSISIHFSEMKGKYMLFLLANMYETLPAC